MNTIVMYVTLGVVFAFCAVAVLLILPNEDIFSRKGKKDKRAGAPAEDDTKTEETN